MASASDPPAHPALQPADQLILPPQPPPPAVETSIGPPHCPPEAPSQTRSFNRDCAPARGTQTLIRLSERRCRLLLNAPTVTACYLLCDQFPTTIKHRDQRAGN